MKLKEHAEQFSGWNVEPEAQAKTQATLK